jgi:hypothetical protein
MTTTVRSNLTPLRLGGSGDKRNPKEKLIDDCGFVAKIYR